MQDLTSDSTLTTGTARPAMFRGALMRSIPYVAVALTTIVVLLQTYGLWHANLSYPIQDLGGDGTLVVYVAKSLGEGSFLHNHRVGAPFGMDCHDMYQPDFVHFTALKILVTVTGNPFLAVNLYYLLGFVLIAWSAFYVLRWFRLSIMVSLLCAVLYAFTPSHLYRSITHLFLSEYYVVPLVVMLALRIMIDFHVDHKLRASSNSWTLLQGEEVQKNRAKRLFYFGAPVALLAGGTGVYYAFYSTLFLSAAAFYAAFRPNRKFHSVVGFSCAALLGLTTIVGLLPALQYRHQHGANLQAIRRTVVDAEVYSLKFADLYLPSLHHPVEGLRKLSGDYNNSMPMLNVNESEFSALGLFGAIGFTALLLWPFLGRSEHDLGAVIKSLVVLNLFGLLYAVTEGFGALFSFLVTPEIRCNTRVIVFIAFFSLFAFGCLLEMLARAIRQERLAQLPFAAMTVVALIVGLYDQGTTQVRAALGPLRSAYDIEDRFVRQIESRCSPGGSVLQLPYQAFPEVPGVYHMGAYEHLDAYLHSRKLRWSFPAMRGRLPDEWIKRLSSAPTSELVKRAVSSGFCGVYIDRKGYDDAAAALEGQLRANAGVAPIVSDDGELSFFSLARYSDALKHGTSSAEWNKLTAEANARPPFALSFLSGVSDPEKEGTREWRWCTKEGEFAIFNPSDRPQKVTLTGRLLTPYTSASFVFFRNTSQTFRAVATSAADSFKWEMILAPGQNHITFNTNAPRVPAPGDPRAMYFQFIGLKVDAE